MALTGAQTYRLARMTGEGHKSTDERMLDDSELVDLANETALVIDDAGLAPAEAGYTATYDLYRAAAEGWRRKAGMVAEGYNIKVEGAAFNRSEAYDHYLAQASRYAGMANSLSV
jgi:hypothetical protein